MITRRRFLALAAAGPGLAGWRVGRAAEPLVRFGVVADAQYADVAPAGSRHYRLAPDRLREAVQHFNRLPLAFAVHLGDLIDRDWASFDRIFEPLSASRHPFHQVLGNHDFDVADALKPRVPERMGMAARHGFFDLAGFRFVILDTTDVSTYAHPAGSAEQRAGEAALEQARAAGLPQAHAWNSGVGRRQLDWFEAACREAGAQGRRVVVFAHHPVFPPGNHNVWNSDDLLGVPGRHPHVVAWFNGHQHAGARAQFGQLPCITVEGMVETPDINAFATVALHADRLVLTGHGRVRSGEWRLGREAGVEAGPADGPGWGARVRGMTARS